MPKYPKLITLRIDETELRQLDALAGKLAGGNRSALVRGLVAASADRLPKLPADIAAAICEEVGE